MKTLPLSLWLLVSGFWTFPVFADSTYTYTLEDNDATLTGFVSGVEPTGAVVVPIAVDGYTVTAIGSAAFKDRTGITALSFASGSGVTRIGAAAFAGCGNLLSFDLPPNLATLGESAFLNCRGLTSIAIPEGVSSLPAQLFYECRSLASVQLHDGITSIGPSAFYNCASLPSFVLPAATVSIGNDAFHGCEGIVSFHLGGALASIGELAFDGCGSLEVFTVDAANESYTASGGVLFDSAQTTLVLAPPALTGNYTVPSTVTTLAEAAFSHSALTGVTLPSGIATIGSDAFYYATTLSWALFSGAAPETGSTVFDGAAGDFTIYYFSGQTGFTSPTWLGYPAAALDIPSPLVTWLTANGFTPGTSLLSDPGQDGVNLLLAYALGLDLSGGLPQPAFDADRLGLTFYGNREGITYSVETSTDLETWTTEDVTLSDLDTDGFRTGSIPVDNTVSRQFLRLVVSY